MTARAPLVLGSNGLPQQLQSGDTIIGGGGGGVNLVSSLPTASSANRGNLYQLETAGAYDLLLLADSPQHYYPLGNGAGASSITDQGVGTTYNSTSVASLVFGSTGGCSDGSTCAYNAQNGDVAFGTSAQLLQASGDWTFEWAFNVQTIASTNNFLILEDANINHYLTVQLKTNGNLQILANAGGFPWTGFTAVPGVWYYAQILFNGTTKVATLYINGVSQGTVTCTSIVIPTVGAGSPPGGAWIAGNGAGSGNYLNGYSQKYAFYNTQISTTLIANHYTYWTTSGKNDTLWISEELIDGTYQMSQIHESLAFPNIIRGYSDLGGVAGLDLWLAARKITGIAAGGAIATWSDSSGNGRNYTGVNSPTWQPASVNNLPAVLFNGSNQYFKPASVYNPTGKMTIMCVLKYSGGNPWSNAKTPSPGGGMTYGSNSNEHLFQASNGSAGWANTSINAGYIDTSNYLLIAIRIGVGLIQCCVNGIPFGAAQPNFSQSIVATGDATYGLLLGVLNNNGSLGGYMTGSIAEFAVFTKVLSEFWWAYTQDYLTNLYQIPT